MQSSNYKVLLDSVYRYSQEQTYAIDKEYIKKIVNKSKDYSVISFDIFDTLLTRLFECPIDLFAYVENQLNQINMGIPNFAKFRFEAEIQSRNIAYQQNKREEITLEEIYINLSKINNIDINKLIKAKEFELLAEFESNVSIQDNQELIKLLKKENKKIIFVSDIYLPQNFIVQLLEKNSLNIYDELYLSSTLKITKNSGRIWDHILKNNKNKKILHIGDNLHADIKSPNKYSIDTYHYSRFLSDRRIGAQLNPNIVPFSFLSKVANMEKGIFSLSEKNEENFWITKGETFGAYILYSFCSWLKEHIKINHINHIYFCARDSQIIHKVWNELEFDKECNTHSSYLFLSRKTVRFPTYYTELLDRNELSETSLNFLVNESVIDNDTYRSYFLKIGLNETDLVHTNFLKKFGSLDSQFDVNKINEIRLFIQTELNLTLLFKYKSAYVNAVKYFTQEGLFDKNKKIAIVDLGWSGSIQLALTELREHNGVNNKLYGFYYGLYSGNATGRFFKNGSMKTAFFNPFSGVVESKLLRNCINILENLHSADHETAIGYKICRVNDKFVPIFKDITKSIHAEQYGKKFKLFQQGALNSIKKLKQKYSMFGIDKYWVNIEYAKAAILQMCITPNKYEQIYFGNILHATLFDHEIHTPLINFQLPSINKEEVNYLLSSGNWECGVINYWKRNQKEIKPELFNHALQYFNDFPTLIKNFIEN